MLATAAVGFVGELVDFPWLIVLLALVILSWKELRNVVVSGEFSVVALFALTAATLAGTLQYDREMFSSAWFLGLMGLVGLSSLLCIQQRLPRKRRIGYVAIHGSIILILLGSGVRNYQKIEGFVNLREGMVTNEMLEMHVGKGTGRTVALPFAVRLDDFEVEFYDTAPMLLVFERGQKEPIAERAISLQEEAEVEGKSVRTLSTETIEISPGKAMQSRGSSVAVIEVDGQEMSLPGREFVTVGPLQFMYHPMGDAQMLFVFKAGVQEPVATLDVAKQEQTEVEGRNIVTKSVKSTSGPPRNHPPIEVEVALVEIDGQEAKIPLGKTLPLGDLLFVYHPVRGDPKRFWSDIALLDKKDLENTLAAQKVEVNQPLQYDGWWIYQSNWDPADETYSGFLVVKDPGLPASIAGLILLVLAALSRIYIPRTEKKEEA